MEKPRSLLEIVLDSFEFSLVHDPRLYNGMRSVFIRVSHGTYGVLYAKVTWKDLPFTFVFNPASEEVWMCDGHADLARAGFIDLEGRAPKGLLEQPPDMQ